MLLETRLLLLLGVANGAPVIAKRLLGARFGRPLDTGIRFLDGRPLFGPSKTLRGLVLAVAAALAAPLLGFTWKTGAGIAFFSMLGDLFSSFVKRRLGMAPSSMALGLDQVPEALLPLVVYREPLQLSWPGIALTVAAFLAAELIVSRWLFRLHIRDRPY